MTLLGSTVSATGIVPLTVPAAATVVVVVVTGRGSEEGMVTGLGLIETRLAGDCLVGDELLALVVAGTERELFGLLDMTPVWLR